MPKRENFDKIKHMTNFIKQKAWIVSVNMGYGHQRTAYPLKLFAFKRKIVNANSYQGISFGDQKIWSSSKNFYEFISRFKRVPIIGHLCFSLYDRYQRILSFYPKRDLSKPDSSLKNFYSLFRKGWGRDLIEKLKRASLPSAQVDGQAIPIISTFFIPAFMAEFFRYPGNIFCVVCDADIARPWAPLMPFSSKIKYFVPNERVVERLKLYGVDSENIFLTGYPLPLENIGSEKLEILKGDLAERLLILDPKKKYFQRYQSLIKRYLGGLPKKATRPLTLTFAVGGAGAQKEIGAKILKSLRDKIKEGKIKIILVAGTRAKVNEYFLKQIKDLGLEDSFNKNVEIIFKEEIGEYFESFNLALRKTDILWTKPSELSFYTALGLPIVLAPCIGSQENFNRDWLLRLGSATMQEDPNYTNEWLFDLLDSGWLAEAAMEGFIEGEKRGIFNIQKVIHSGKL